MISQGMDKLGKKFKKYLKKLNKYPCMVDEIVGKCDEECPVFFKNQSLSVIARVEANKLYTKDNHDDATHQRIFQLYNQSLAFAPTDSETLATAYGNRSAVLRHLHRYADSIIEADKALKITESDQLKLKLLCRQADCYTALGSAENEKCFQKAKFIFVFSKDSEQVRQKMNDLLTKTRATIAAGKLDMPKENLRKAESLRIRQEAEKLDLWSCVQLKHEKYYGRHFVAARDFKPGDVIFTEKPYANNLVASKLLLNCSHCLRFLWTAIPCDNCSLRLFCSEECKAEAMQEYHDIECLIVVKMDDALLYKISTLQPLVIRTFIKGLKEAGSLTQLRKDLKAVDECKDECKKGLLPNGEWKGFHIIYAREYRRLEDSKFQHYMKLSFLALMGLAKFSSLFEAKYDMNQIDKLIADESAMFAGTLLLKLCLLTCCRNTTEPEPQNIIKRNMASQDEDSLSVKSIGYLPRFGCVPNAFTYFTEGTRFVTHCITPIKKGSPIIIPGLSVYNFVPRENRQDAHEKLYNRLCDCEACRYDWSDKLRDPLRPVTDSMERWIHPEIIEDIEALSKAIQAKDTTLDFPELKMLPKAKKLMEKAWEELEMPSIFTVQAVLNLTQLLMSLHLPKYDSFEWKSTCE